MTAKKRPAQKPLPPMPLSELPMMKALLAMAAPLADGQDGRPAGDPRESDKELTTLRLTIIDKLQVLALRRPRALVIVAQMVDRLLDRQLAVLDEDPISEHADEHVQQAEQRRAAHGKRVATAARPASSGKPRESRQSVA
jgi:hypothetical protein